MLRAFKPSQCGLDVHNTKPHKNLMRWILLLIVFSVNLVCKKELNLILKVSETSSQGAVGLSLRGTDFIYWGTTIIAGAKSDHINSSVNMPQADSFGTLARQRTCFLFPVDYPQAITAGIKRVYVEGRNLNAFNDFTEHVG